jgi:hypothetical protein
MSESIPDIDEHAENQHWGWVDVDSDTGEVVVFEAPLQSAKSFIDSIETFKSLPSIIEHEEKKAARRRASNPLFQRVKLNRDTQTKMDGKKTSVGNEDSDSSSGETCSLSSTCETYSFSTDDGFYFDKAKLLPLIEAESGSEGEQASAPIFEAEVEVIAPTINHLGGVGRIEEAEKVEEKTDEDSATESEDEDERTEKVSLLEFLRRDELTLAAVCTIFLFGSMWALEQGRGPASVFMRRL